MIYSKTMNEQSPTSELGIIITVVSGALIGWWKYVTDSFKDKKAARDAETERQEKERSETITRAVKDGLESFNREFRHEMQLHRDETTKEFRVIHKRIDDVLINHKDK